MSSFLHSYTALSLHSQPPYQQHKNSWSKLLPHNRKHEPQHGTWKRVQKRQRTPLPKHGQSNIILDNDGPYGVVIKVMLSC